MLNGILSIVRFLWYNKTMQKKPTSAYVHIPFCTQICYYCDFSKVFIKNQPVDSYLEHLLEEFQSYDIQKLSTLYIGGGTPTALSAPQLEVLLDGLTKNLDLSVLEELTIEANPGDLDADKIAVLKNSAVNRVSLGVQTFDDKMLKKIGRSHLEKDIYENIDRLKLVGFDNISIDLIYALPGQTMEQVKENVAKAIGLDIPHMSLYSLILENHTVFMNRMRRGKLPLPKEELEAEMFEYIITELERAGFEHYEISNFSKPSFESRHNLMYWDNAEYYGIGAGASGYVNGVRYKNHGPIRHYLSAVEEGNARITEEHLSQKEQMEEEMFLGLRKKSGVSIIRFEKKFGQSFEGLYGEIVRDLVQQGLMQIDGDRVRMTKRGLFLGDTVAERFILE
ncbi:Oxygen-independent coproporphyrinogen-III oxidase 1 [Streptococcus mitis]|uniref:Heme chaperone HemW n=2 Tax=Streptococcus mitis TaxID=28037 RepID=A0A428I3Z5_STRMT|nr:Oxygen-independent coproporphyrinogen-III oxidase 1 [Streptococcus mitis]